MRHLAPDFAARLSGGVTTLCTCWRLTRADGRVQGFTDHDADLVVDGQLYEARSGLDSSAFESTLGLAVGGAEVSGALTAASLTEADLAAGAWDGARVEIRRVDWAAPQRHVLLEVAAIGEVRRAESGFVAELRGLAQALDEERGRLFQARCDADLGDARCRAAVDAAPFTREAVAAAGCAPGEIVVALDAPAGWFAGGRAHVLSGPLAGAVARVKDHRVDGAHRLALWTPLAAAPAPGDVLRLVAGCDKTWDACRTKFANGANFRGFPHMPGDDHVLAYPGGAAAMDGGSLFR